MSAAGPGSGGAESPLSAVFYAIHGPNDPAFGVFFAWVSATTLCASR